MINAKEKNNNDSQTEDSALTRSLKLTRKQTTSRAKPLFISVKNFVEILTVIYL